MTQPYPTPSTPRGKRAQVDYQVVPPQRTTVDPVFREPPAPRKVKRWPAALGAGVLGLFVGVGLGASSPSPQATPQATDTASTTTYITETVQAPASTVTVFASAPEPETRAVAKPVPAAAAPAPASTGGPMTTFSDGTYEVGTGDGEIPPGKYRSSGPDSGGLGICYASRLKHNDGALGDIVDQEVSKGQTLINVQASDGYVQVSGCTFTRA
jgi:hypothetical protein